MVQQEKIQKIQQVVCDVTGLTIDQLKERSARREKVFGRMIISKELRNYGLTLQSIGEILGRNHSVVMHYLKIFDNEMATNPSF